MGNTDLSARRFRPLLLGATTIYVRTDGSDSNSGFANSSGGAFLTLQHAVDYAASLDNNGFDITIQLGAGTYNVPTCFLRSFSGYGSIIIVGDETTPSNVVVNSTVAAVFDATRVRGVWKIRGIKGTGQGAASQFIIVRQGGYCEVQNIDLGAGLLAQQLRAQDNGILGVTGNFAVSTPTGTIISCLSTGNNGVLRMTNAPVCTFLAAAAYSASSFANVASCGTMVANSFTFGGMSITGQRYSATQNGVILGTSANASYFPGDSAGATATGGVYA